MLSKTALLLLSVTMPGMSAQDQQFTIDDIHHTVPLTLTNPLALARLNETVSIGLGVLTSAISPGQELVALVDGERVPSQWLDNDLDGNINTLTLSVSFAPKQSRQLKLLPLSSGFAAQPVAPGTYAELAVRMGGHKDQNGLYEGGDYVPVSHFALPSDHGIGNRLFKYEGVGWESSKIAYRFYFDHRSATDIFGKQTHDLVMQNVGLDGSDYHSLQPWGMDVLKVGPTVGVGGVATFADKEIQGINTFSDAQGSISNGAVSSSVTFSHHNWQTSAATVDVVSRFSISRDSELTQVTVRSAAPLPAWSAGFVDHEVSTFRSDDTQPWCYLASYGKQSLNNDNLGLAVFFRCHDKQQYLNQQHTLAAVLSGGNYTQYYMAGNWQRAPEGAKNAAQFEAWLKQWQARLSHPIEVAVK